MTTATMAARYVGGHAICIDSPGAMQSSWTVPSRILVRLPDEISLRDAALVEPAYSNHPLRPRPDAYVLAEGVEAMEIRVITTVDLAAAGVSEAEPLDLDRVEVKG